MQIKFSTCGEIKAGFEKASPAFKAPSQHSGVEGASDNVKGVGHTKSMTEITREEFNAKLETIEVKMDARVESVSAKIDAFVAIQAERDKRMEATLNQISSNHGEIKSSIGSMKTTMIVTAVSTVLAIVIGIAGFNAMLTSNMVASFQMGRSEKALDTPPAQKSEQAPASAPQK
ncbi:hypothetical protein [Pseudomonas extremorientalis]|uniref:Uncharacterized protein n=2 Tax=Pseudomonas extremorientalis TaxID=169669 RepID=A0ABY0RXW4_9PSED|nr:hypothetical protein [Pseudomonas extremorientalis]KAB0517520.1 hypothetical protein F7R08_18015 [Pseudomonas extremorientalis]SDO60923.1 hypothetical protein SAMN04490184_0979 [Pseudomonas extremorientalis]